MKFNRCIQPWVFAVVGGLMILGSVSLGGIIVSQKNKALKKVEAEISDIERTYIGATEAFNTAIIKSDLAHILRTVVRFSIFQDKQIQNNWNEIHAASLYSQLLNLHTAIGKQLKPSIIKTLKDMTEKAQAGDSEAYEGLGNLVVKLIEESGHYRGDLIIDKTELQIKASGIENEISHIREIAAIIQLLGLVVLLLKELPESYFRKSESVANIPNN